MEKTLGVCRNKGGFMNYVAISSNSVPCGSDIQNSRLFSAKWLQMKYKLFSEIHIMIYYQIYLT